MKRTMTLALLLVISLGSFSQLKVVENKTKTIYESPQRECSLVMFGEPDNPWYALYYQDQNYKSIVSLESIVFKSKSEVLEFVEVVNNVIVNGEKYNVTIGKDMYIIDRLARKGWVMVFASKGYFYMDAKINEGILKSLE